MSLAHLELNKHNKQVIRMLEKDLDTLHPFRYGVIEGERLFIELKNLSRRFYYVDDDGQRKNLKDFIAEIENGLNELAPQTANETLKKNKVEQLLQASQVNQIDWLIRACLRNFHRQLVILHTQELELMTSCSNHDEAIKLIDTFRKKTIKFCVNDSLKLNNRKGYVVANEMKQLKLTLREHLDYMLPNISDYLAQIPNEAIKAQIKEQTNKAKPTTVNKLEMPAFTLNDSALLNLNRKELLALQEKVASILHTQQQQALSEIAKLMQSHDLTLNDLKMSGYETDKTSTA